MNKKLLLGCLCSVALVLGACGQKESGTSRSGTEEAVETNEHFVEEIREKGHLTVGCKMDVPDLGLYDDKADTWSGLEVELAYQTAANLFDVSVDEAKKRELVEFVGVTVADREEKLESGEVDCLFATYTITKEREKRFAFSDSYYTDYIGLLVNTSGENINSLGTDEIRSLADLDGKYIGVPRNATTREAFLKYIDTMNAVKVSPIFCEYESYEALFKALKDGNIDAMSVDVSILNGYVDNTTVILGDRFGGQYYGAAVKKENVRLLDFINRAVSGED